MPTLSAKLLAEFGRGYILDFLGLKGAFHEKDLESAVIRDLAAFLVELGGDFAFLARQKRITVDREDFYLDLLHPDFAKHSDKSRRRNRPGGPP